MAMRPTLSQVVAAVDPADRDRMVAVRKAIAIAEVCDEYNARRIARSELIDAILKGV